MDPNTFPTKGNLILAKNSLALSRQGFELMDKKRNILIREMMELIDQAKDIQTQIDETFRTAYAALQKANMEIGIAFVQQISYTVPVENSIRIKTRSVMGTEIPLVEYDAQSTNTPTYAYYSTKMSLDQAKAEIEKVKELSIRLSMIENAAIRLAANIKKTQKRANALKNITIPRYEKLTRDIQNALEEKEREAECCVSRFLWITFFFRLYPQCTKNPRKRIFLLFRGFLFFHNSKHYKMYTIMFSILYDVILFIHANFS